MSRMLLELISSAYRKLTTREVRFSLIAKDAMMPHGLQTLGVIHYEADGHPAGFTVVRTVWGYCVALDGFVGDHRGTTLGAELDLAKLGYVRLWRRRGDKFQLEHNLTITPPVEAEAYIVCPYTGEVYPEYYGRRWKDHTAAGGMSEVGPLDDRYASGRQHVKCRYFFGDEVIFWENRGRSLDDAARLLAEDAAA